MKKKKVEIIKLDKDFSFEELVQHIANVKATDVDEVMMTNEESEDLPIQDEESEPKEEC